MCSVYSQTVKQDNMQPGDTMAFVEKGAGLKIEMVYVQGGSFYMGCGIDQGRTCEDDEEPPHHVTLGDFFIARYEVTQKQWFLMMENNPSNFAGCDSCPVENVSWNDVQLFLEKLNSMTGKKYCLPSEAQWEYAARGGNRSRGFRYSGSDNINEVAWYLEGKGNKNLKTSKTHIIGKKNPNELGLYDMSGNVWEWCGDGYAKYTNIRQIDPKGSVLSAYKIFRGGSWNNSANHCRVFYRHYLIPDSRYYNLGLRLALVP